MKKVRQIIALAITAVMIIATGITGLAAGGEQAVNVGPGNVTVTLANGATDSGTAQAYKIMDLEVTGGTNEYKYIVNNDFAATLKTILGLKSEATNAEVLKTIEDLSNDAQKVKYLAESLTTAIEANPDTFKNAKTDITITNGNGTASLGYGYYLITFKGTAQNAKVQRSLVIVDSEQEAITLKVEEPPFIKKADKPTAEIGQEVTYTIETEVPDVTGSTNYDFIIKDKISAGLDFIPVTVDTQKYVEVSVNIEGANNNPQNIETKAYLSQDEKTMTLDLSDFINKADIQNYKGKKLTVTYKAKVNEKAVNIVEKNKAELHYGNKGEVITNPSTAETKVYPLQIRKKDKNDVLLSGAEFKLYRSNAEGKIDENNQVKVTGGNGSYTVTQDGQDVSPMVTVKDELDGKGYNLKVNGLAAGVYWLKEIKAPEGGYNPLTDPIRIEIVEGTGAEYTISKDGTEEADKVIDIENNKGGLLPETGGMGTILFTVAGLTLILMAAFGMKKAKKEN